MSWYIGLRYTVRSRYIAVTFLCITHERRSMACPSGRCVGCRSWVQNWPRFYHSNRCAVYTIVSHNINISRVYSNALGCIWLYIYHTYAYVYTSECRFNTAQYSMIFHTAWHWLMQNINLLKLTRGTPYVTLSGELWSIYGDNFGEKLTSL